MAHEPRLRQILKHVPQLSMSSAVQLTLDGHKADVYEVTPVNPYMSDDELTRSYEALAQSIVGLGDDDVSRRARIEVVETMTADPRERSIQPREFKAIVIRHPSAMAWGGLSQRADRMLCPLVAGLALALGFLLYCLALFILPGRNGL